MIDFGGGTLDVSCCEFEKNDIKVKQTGGNQKIGGNNFDECTVQLKSLLRIKSLLRPSF